MDKNLKKLKVQIVGMHCKSCEILLEKNFKKVPGVAHASADFKKSEVVIGYEGEKPGNDEIENAVRNAGYKVGRDTNKKFFSRNPIDYQELIIAAGSLFILFVILYFTGIFETNLAISSTPSIGVSLLIGLAAGISTCMALVGGLVVGIAARYAEKHPEATRMQKFRPHLFFNLGRIIGYGLFGGIIGILGSALALKDATLGILIIVVSLVMIFIGLKLLGIMPGLERYGFHLPKGLSKLFGAGQDIKEYNHRGAFISGAMTFFLPCGFTQAMQLYAVSTGSFTQGMFIMAAFALGTAPGLLGLGGISSIIKGYWSRFFFKTIGIIVIVLGIINIQSGYNLTGWTFGAVVKVLPDGDQAELVDGVQIVKMQQRGNGYFPNQFTVKKGIPVRWEITSTEQFSCASYLLSRGLNISQMLKPGKNVIEFTPDQVGPIRFSCSMGMYSGIINVVE